MRALSLIHPWSAFIAAGLKQYETRSWSTTYRGLLAVHASQKIVVPRFAVPPTLPRHRGCFLCVGELVAVHDVTPAFVETLSEQERTLGNYDTTNGPRYAWELANVLPLVDPIPCRGSLGLWNVPASALERFRYQVGVRHLPRNYV